LFKLLTVSVICQTIIYHLINYHLTNLVLLACLYLNLSKNSSLMAFFRKADAKVELFSIRAKHSHLFFFTFFLKKHNQLIHNLLRTKYFSSSRNTGSSFPPFYTLLFIREHIYNKDIIHTIKMKIRALTKNESKNKNLSLKEH